MRLKYHSHRESFEKCVKLVKMRQTGQVATGFEFALDTYVSRPLIAFYGKQGRQKHLAF
jgi:hypothetical protein